MDLPHRLVDYLSHEWSNTSTVVICHNLPNCYPRDVSTSPRAVPPAPLPPPYILAAAVPLLSPSLTTFLSGFPRWCLWPTGGGAGPQVSHRESAKAGVGVLRGKSNRGLATPRTAHGPRKGSCVLLGTVCRLAQQQAILEQPLPNSPPNSNITTLKPVQHPCLHLFRPPGWLSRMSPPVRFISVLLTYCSSARLRRSMGSVG